MNKLTKLITATAVATLAFAMPVLANPSLPLSSTDVNQLVQQIDGHAIKTMVDAGYSMSTQVNPATVVNHIDKVADQVAKLDKEAAQNHLFYLQKCIENAKENVRIKQEIVTNYTNLAKVNPQFADMLPAANAELVNALNDQVKAEAALEQAKVTLGKYL